MGQIVRTMNNMKAICLDMIHDLKPHHMITSATSIVLDLTPTLQLPIDSNKHRKPKVDPLTTKSILYDLDLSK